MRLLVLFALALIPGQVAAQADTYDRGRFVEASLRASGLSATVSQVRAEAEAEAALARSLAMPEFEVSVWAIPFETPHRWDEAAMWMAFFQQDFGVRGVRSARAEAADRGGDSRAEETRLEAFGLALDAASLHDTWLAYVERAAARRIALAALRERIAFAERTASGSTRSVYDLARLRTEATRMEGELAEDESAIAAVLATVRTYLALPVDAEPHAISEALAIDLEALRAALREHPALAGLEARDAAARAELRAASLASRRPNVAAGLGLFVERGGMPGYGFSVSLGLPFASGRARAEERLARAVLERTAAERAAVEAELARALAEALRRYELARRALERLERVDAPALETLVASAMAGVSAGTVSTDELLALRVESAELGLLVVEARSEVREAEVPLYVLGLAGRGVLP